MNLFLLRYLCLGFIIFIVLVNILLMFSLYFLCTVVFKSKNLTVFPLSISESNYTGFLNFMANI